MRTGPPSLDIVIPLYNEQEILPSLLGKLSQVFSVSQLTENQIQSVHFLFIDDGSRDGTARILNEKIQEGLPATLIRLSRNFGHQNAVTAGLDQSTAELVAVMDADLQDPPEVILQMVARWREGYDVVYAVRRRRKENPFKVLCYWIFYRLLAFLSEIDIAMDSGDFSLMNRRVLLALRTLPEKLRFPRGLRSWVGFKQTGIEYDRPARQRGRTKYTLKKLYQLATDGIASLSIRPLKLSQFFSFVFLTLLAAFSLLMFSKFATSVSEHDRIALWALVGYMLVAASSFIQTLCIYILGAYVGRTYLEVKQRPPYIVQEIISSKSSPARIHARP